MKIIGLMGGVGSGKSTVANILKEEFGAHLIITDDIARKFCDKGEPSYNKIVSYFGEEVLLEDGQLNRRRLGEIVFNDKEKLEVLNSFTHPLVKEYVIQQIQQIKEHNRVAKADDVIPYVVIETALLIDAGYRELCDEVWYVAVSEEVRRQRLIESRGYSEEKITSILKNQMSDKDFSDNCDKILYNNDNINNLVKEIQFLLVNKN